MTCPGFGIAAMRCYSTSGPILEQRGKLVIEHRQCRSDGHMHIQVLVGTKAAPEEDTVFILHKLTVLLQALAILRGIHRVVGLVAMISKARELTEDHGLLVLLVTLGVEVAEFNDSREGNIDIAIVHDGATLVVTGFDNFLFEIDGTPGQVTC